MGAEILSNIQTDYNMASTLMGELFWNLDIEDDRKRL